ncbi:MAG: phosphopantetheine-binding protein [Succinivibrionaceae bacterium]|nr:phosphopantetheine-binding protein [Succinivibrionaceae bacterium]
MGLDSIDALELGIAMKKKFGVTISPDTENVKQYFQSVAALMKFVEMQRAGKEESK